jgi:hypothetical protein
MQSFLAYITPLASGGEPSHPIAPGGPPPGIWPSPGYPAHPIAPGGGPSHPIVLPIPPDAIAPGVPTHPIYIPVEPGHPIVIPPEAIGPGVPTHPIVLPPLPPEVWPGPGQPAHPIVIPPDAVSPGVPSHPIVLPPPVVWPPNVGVGHPIAPGGGPSHPIVLPPPNQPPTLPPPDSVPVGTVLVLVQTPEGLKWATQVVAGPPYNPPPGGSVPTPVGPKK